ncbi:MAG: helix-hairpin-helix domain-containing protein [candidate division WOR-3 bacterium]
MLLAAGTQPRSDFRTLRILCTGDLHCQAASMPDFASAGLPRRLLGGWHGLKRLIEQERTDASLLLDCGDFAFGSAESDSTQGRIAVEFMNLCGYDAACFGARDFNGGLANLEVLATTAQFPILADPLLDALLHRQVPLFRPYCVKRVAGIRVGIVGITDPSVSFYNLRRNTGGFSVDEPLKQARRYLAALREESVDITLVLAHVDTRTAVVLAESLSGVDLIICAGSAMDIDSPLPAGSQVPIVRNGVYGQRLGEVDILFNLRERKVYQCEARVLNVEPLKASGEKQVGVGSNEPYLDCVLATAQCEFGPELAGRVMLSTLAARAVAEQSQADIAIVPIELLEAGLTVGPLRRRDLIAAFPYRDPLRLIFLPESLLPEVVRPKGASDDQWAPAIWGADYFVAGDTGRWPVLGQLVGPRLRIRQRRPIKLVAPEWWIERTSLTDRGRLLPSNLTDSWLAYAAHASTLAPTDTVRVMLAGALSRPAAARDLININTADAALLQTLPGIGPATAQRIIEYRNQRGLFQSVDELDNVKGIGPKKLEKIRPLVTVR